jgi:hypothetical protein
MHIDEAIANLQEIKKSGDTKICFVIWTDSDLKKIASDSDVEITDEDIDKIIDEVEEEGLRTTGEYIDDMICDLRNE